MEEGQVLPGNAESNIVDDGGRDDFGPGEDSVVVIALVLLVVSLVRRQRFAPWVLLLGVVLLIVPFAVIYIWPRSAFAGLFPYDLVWGGSLPVIVVGAFALCFRFWRRAAE